MAYAGKACEGKYKQATVASDTIYCTHPDAPAYTCPFLCSHDLCPIAGKVVPKSEVK